MTFEEKRVAPRFHVQVPTEYENSHSGSDLKGSDPTGSGMTANLSTSGVLIEPASTSMAVETGIQLRFAFFIGSSHTVFRGTVVRQTSDGFAVHFGDMDEAQLGVVRRIRQLAPVAPR